MAASLAEEGSHDGRAAAEEMAKADPDLDPVWGLLISSVPAKDSVSVENYQLGSTRHDGDEQSSDSPLDQQDDEDDEDDHGIVQACEAEAKPISNVVDKEEVSAEIFEPCRDSWEYVLSLWVLYSSRKQLKSSFFLGFQVQQRSFRQSLTSVLWARWCGGTSRAVMPLSWTMSSAPPNALLW